MKSFRWNIEKNELLKFERGISFEAVVVALETLHKELLDKAYLDKAMQEVLLMITVFHQDTVQAVVQANQLAPLA